MFEFSNLTIAVLVALAFGGMFVVIRSVVGNSGKTPQPRP